LTDEAKQQLGVVCRRPAHSPSEGVSRTRLTFGYDIQAVSVDPSSKL
jgi:hypothetical protein